MLGVVALQLDGLAANLVAVQLTGIWIMPWAIVLMFLLPFGLEGYARVPMTAGIEVIMNVVHSVASLAGAVGFVRTGSIAGISIVALADYGFVCGGDVGVSLASSVVRYL